jgi:hypothetical protein
MSSDVVCHSPAAELYCGAVPYRATSALHRTRCGSANKAKEEKQEQRLMATYKTLCALLQRLCGGLLFAEER